jgi:hypothetical protein
VGPVAEGDQALEKAKGFGLLFAEGKKAKGFAQYRMAGYLPAEKGFANPPKAGVQCGSISSGLRPTPGQPRSGGPEALHFASRSEAEAL